MDTTENKTEQYTKKPYPEFKPEKAGEYLCGNKNFSFNAVWDNDCWAVRNPDAIAYFFEPSPMEVKDAELIIWDGVDCELVKCKSHEDFEKYVRDNYVDKIDGVHPDVESIRLYQEVSHVEVKTIDGAKNEQFDEIVELSFPRQLQPPVISAEEFLKEKDSRFTGNWQVKMGRQELINWLTEYLQRQGQKTNQTKL